MPAPAHKATLFTAFYAAVIAVSVTINALLTARRWLLIVALVSGAVAVVAFVRARFQFRKYRRAEED